MKMGGELFEIFNLLNEFFGEARGVKRSESNGKITLDLIYVAKQVCKAIALKILAV